jgi:hypothetical protein
MDKKIQYINELDAIISRTMQYEHFAKSSLDKQALLIEQQLYEQFGWAEDLWDGAVDAYDATSDWVNDLDGEEVLDYVQYTLAAVSVGAYTGAGVAALTVVGNAGPSEVLAIVGYCASALDATIDLGRGLHAISNNNEGMATVYFASALIGYCGASGFKSTLKPMIMPAVKRVFTKAAAESTSKVAKKSAVDAFQYVSTTTGEEIANTTIKKSASVITDGQIKLEIETLKKTTKELLQVNSKKAAEEIVQKAAIEAEKIQATQIAKNAYILKTSLSKRAIGTNVYKILTHIPLGGDGENYPNLLQNMKFGFQTDDNTIGGFPAIGPTAANFSKEGEYMEPFGKLFGLDPDREYQISDPYYTRLSKKLLDPAIDASQKTTVSDDPKMNIDYNPNVNPFDDRKIDSTDINNAYDMPTVEPNDSIMLKKNNKK